MTNGNLPHQTSVRDDASTIPRMALRGIGRTACSPRLRHEQTSAEPDHGQPRDDLLAGCGYRHGQHGPGRYMVRISQLPTSCQLGSSWTEPKLASLLTCPARRFTANLSGSSGSRHPCKRAHLRIADPVTPRYSAARADEDRAWIRRSAITCSSWADVKSEP